jgi:hypothetical protein
MTMRQHRVPSAADLSVPSPLVGEGQGGGCDTASSHDLHLEHARRLRPPPVGLPPSPALPHKGGGSASLMRRDEFGQEKQLQWGLT